MVFNILLCRGNHHLHFYKIPSLMAITRNNKVYFSNNLPNAIKKSIFTRELLVGETSKNDIWIAKPKLLLLPLKFLIPLRIQLLMV